MGKSSRYKQDDVRSNQSSFFMDLPVCVNIHDLRTHIFL